jgi:hypothetical protein
MDSRIKICKLGLGQRVITEGKIEGSYYPKVDGVHVGENGRAYWETKEQAQGCAERFIQAEAESLLP